MLLQKLTGWMRTYGLNSIAPVFAFTKDAEPGDEFYPYRRHPVTAVEVDAGERYVDLVFVADGAEPKPLTVAGLFALFEEQQALEDYELRLVGIVWSHEFPESEEETGLTLLWTLPAVGIISHETMRELGVLAWWEEFDDGAPPGFEPVKPS